MALREEGGDWKDDTTYVIRLNAEGDSVALHPYHPLAQGGFIDDEQGVGQRLVNEAKENSDEIRCAPYIFDGVDR